MTEAARHNPIAGSGRWLAAWLVFAGICAATVLYFALVFVPGERTAATEVWRGRLSAMADDRKAAISAWLDERRSDARVVAEYPTVAAVLLGQDVRRSVPPSSEPAQHHLRGLLDSVQAAYGFSGVYLLDSSVQVRSSSSGSAQLEAGCRAASERTLHSGLAQVDLHTHEDSAPMLAVTAPVIVQGRAVGAVLLSVDPGRWLYPLLASEPIPSRSAESLLGRQVGDHIEYLSPLRLRPGRPMSFRLPVSAAPLAVVAAIRGEEGFREYPDYRGVRVLGATRHIPGTDWGLVVKVDREEAMAEAGRNVGQGAMAIAGLLLAMAGLGFGAQRTLAAHHHRELAESEERFRTMVDSFPQLAWVAKADGFIQWYNRRWFEYTGTTPAQMEGWGWQSVHDPDVLPRVMEQWQGSIATGRRFDMEFPLRGADGTFRPFLTRVVPLKDAKGKVLQWFGTNTDISERVAAEQVMREANETLEAHVQERTAELTDALQAIRSLNADLERRAGELEAVNKELEAFSYSVSHDLRAPLRAIDGFSRIVMEDHGDRLGDEGKRQLEVVRANTQKMGRLIDDLLAFSRAGRAELRRLDVDMVSLVHSVFHELVATEEERARIDFSVGDLADGWADDALIRQVWFNLLSNAVKFSHPRHRAEIRVTGTSDDHRVVYHVSDNGVGFDMRYVDKLFKVFQRLHSSREFEGTGVGLALVHRIVQRHGGEVWAEGVVDGGAAFSFALPEEAEHEQR